MARVHYIWACSAVILLVFCMAILNCGVLFSERCALVLPKYEKWPQEVQDAARKFSASMPEGRGEEGRLLWAYLSDPIKRKNLRPLDLWTKRNNVLTCHKVKAIFGKPSEEMGDYIYYAVGDSMGNKYFIAFKFNDCVLEYVGMSK